MLFQQTAINSVSIKAAPKHCPENERFREKSGFCGPGHCSIAATLFWLVGARIQQQISELSDKLPGMIDQARSKLQEYPWGEKVIDQFSGDKAEKYMKSAQQFFNSTFGALGDLYVILFLSIFLTAEPGVYIVCEGNIKT